MMTQNKFTSVAFIMGMLSLLTSSSFFGGIIFGGLAIIFAELSKADGIKLNKKSNIAFWAGLFGMIFSIAITVFNIYQYLHNPDYKATIDASFKQVYGMNADQLFKEFISSFTGN